MERKDRAKEDYLAGIMEHIQGNVQACIQCGTCTGSCSSAFAMDLTPRQMWRLVQVGHFDQVLNSKTFFLCSACYYCTLRCPRGLPLTETIGALKRLASATGIKRYKESVNFYRAFMDTVKRYGRVREMEFMNRYFLSMRNPLFPLRFTSMGLKLMGKRKVPIQAPRLMGEGKFDRLFRKVEKLEERA
ncbi:MAG: 4Fe-4S dicluster domain-containing protein [Deltaproteobacteria bacterium]|nr:4Fe-4S dicluster domain-containing protein [Deltaproteobacteria bacterium]